MYQHLEKIGSTPAPQRGKLAFPAPSLRLSGAAMDGDALFDSEEVILDYPLWTFTRNGKVSTIGAPGFDSLMPAVFTDREAAQWFLDESRIQGAEPLAIKDPPTLLKILYHFKKAGLTHVAFDIWLHTKTGEFVPIEQFIDGVWNSAAQFLPLSPPRHQTPLNGQAGNYNAAGAEEQIQESAK